MSVLPEIRSFVRVEVGLNPQKTMENWSEEDRTEHMSMTFEQAREHLNHNVTKQIINILLKVERNPVGVERDLEQMRVLVSTLTYISEVVADLPNSINQAKTQRDLLDTMTEAITDIQTKIKQTIVEEVEP